MPKISVIIPVYNSENYLEKCLDSVINQTLDDVEIIVVNDGSPDNSQEIIDRYKSNYPSKIKAIYQENHGQAAARNNGIQYATGEYIAFVDSDDYLELDAYEKAYSLAKENDSDIVCFGFFEVNGETRKAIDYTVFPVPKNDVRYILNETSPSNKLIKRNIWSENNIRFTENRIYEDLELIPQLALYTKKIVFMNDNLYNYVIHSGSTMRQKTYNQKLASIYPVVDTLKEKFWNTPYHTELEYLYIEHLLHGAVLRYLGYKEGSKDIQKISSIMKKTFPAWHKNIYYKKLNMKYKIVCWLAYLKQIKLLRLLLGVKNV